MAGLKRGLASCAVIATVCIVGLPVLAQNRGGRGANPTQAATAAQTAKPPVKIAGDFDKVHILEPGAPTPRTRDGHPDLSGRYYPNHAGRMLQGAYRIPDPIMRQYDPVKTPQENPVFRPDAVDKYLHATPYGSCPPGGTPTSITTQATERFSRPSKNYLIYQLTVEDPEVLVKPFTSAPHVWTLAQAPNDVWTEYICTTNEEPDVYKNLDQKTKDEYEKSGRSGAR